MKYISKTRMGRWGENAVYRQEIKKLIFLMTKRLDTLESKTLKPNEK